jgi:hypothetical protein
MPIHINLHTVLHIEDNRDTGNTTWDLRRPKYSKWPALRQLQLHALTGTWLQVSAEYSSIRSIILRH